MRIGVISDTHIPKAAPWLPNKIIEDFKNVDLILHAGDFVDVDFFEELNKLAPVRAVHGNMDDIYLKKTLPFKAIVKVGKFKIGLIHGYGPSLGLTGRVKKEFEKNRVDVIVFGHSHFSKNEKKGGVLFFNPGSPTDKFSTRFNSYGILHINDTVKGEIIKL